jgi:hypothetical protein
MLWTARRGPTVSDLRPPEAASQSPVGSWSRRWSVRLNGPFEYRMDAHSGSDSLACDGRHWWRWTDQTRLAGPPRPLRHSVSWLIDPSWVLSSYVIGEGKETNAVGRGVIVHAVEGDSRWTQPAVLPPGDACTMTIDGQRGLLLGLDLQYRGRTFMKVAMTDVAFDEPISPDEFRPPWEPGINALYLERTEVIGPMARKHASSFADDDSLP